METSFKFYILEEVKKLLRLPFCKNKYNNMNTSIMVTGEFVDLH